ncbi:MAG: hypothetical protein R3D00_15460 [Bacteroidia bacterium]
MRKRNLFMSTTIMCGLLCFAFRFDSGGVYWLWADHKPVAIILAIAAFGLAIGWYKTSHQPQ